MLFAALLLAASAPVAAQTAKPEAEASESASDEKKDDFDIAQVMAMFDKLFPAQPDPAPARLALARTTANGMLPSGLYADLFDEVMSGVVDRVLALNPADFGAKAGKDKAPTATSLRQQIAREDPHFEERMRIMERVIREELVKISTVMEPKMREGLARSMARRFDEKQLKEINTFLATESGKAFAAQNMRMWVDPDVMRSMVQTIPHMITAMPGAMMRLEAETAHLPKPKKEEKAKEPEAEAEDAPDEA
jgi:hypothetical protein